MTARRFDRERQREYSVTVTATDWAEEPLIGICQLTVQIQDQNDNSPKFENLRYERKNRIKIIHACATALQKLESLKQYEDLENTEVKRRLVLSIFTLISILI